ncbi:MAG: VWA domain-containing protein [Pyrinomonadaceae bacterium]|nr:VWA domain-containing protein [Pyrinomonadaceae bacterium]
MINKKLNIIAVILLLLSASITPAQDETVKVETDLVTLPVFVSDKDGRFVSGLKASDFEILENGKPQETAFFETAEVPVTVLLLIDVSGSMNDHLSTLASAANKFVQSLAPEDQIIVATFRDKAHLDILCPPTKKHSFTQTIFFKKTNDDWLTMTFNAVDKSIDYMARLPGRKAIVMFSDGELYGKGVSAKSNLNKAEESDAVIYTVRFGEYPKAQRWYTKPSVEDIDRYGNSLGLPPNELKKVIAEVKSYMNGLADKTGGGAVEIGEVSLLVPAFQQISLDLKRMYRLGYYPQVPPKSGERRKIRLLMKAPGTSVRARKEVVFGTPLKIQKPNQ